MLFVLICVGMGGCIMLQPTEEKLTVNKIDDTRIRLPELKYDSGTSVEQAIHERRSVREYKGKKLKITDVSQILWAAQGISDSAGYRTTPSAGALYPLELYAVIGNVEDVAQGVYKYRPREHELVKVRDGDIRNHLADAALRQDFIKEAALVLVFSAVYERTTQKYGDRGIRYVQIEIGHAAQNVYLQAVSLDLGTVAVGAFHDNKVSEILNMPDKEIPLYIMPIGRM